MDPKRPLPILQNLDKAKDRLKESDFDIDSLECLALQIAIEGDLVTIMNNKNGLMFPVYFDTVFMTPMGMKLFDAPQLSQNL